MKEDQKDVEEEINIKEMIKQQKRKKLAEQEEGNEQGKQTRAEEGKDRNSEKKR